MAKKTGVPQIIKIDGLERNISQIVERINLLFDALSLKGQGRKMNLVELNAILINFKFNLFMIELDDELVGMGSLYFRQTLSRCTAYIEDVVVLLEHQGSGLGKLLLERLIYEARQNNVDVIELTSNPTWVVANAMYQKAGFVRPETNLYRMYL